jgi:nucleotide-binding universal stress UspA family protein
MPDTRDSMGPTVIGAIPPTAPTTIVVATDGRRESDGAVRVGRALARRDAVSLDLISAIDPFTMLDHEGGPLPDIQHLTTLVRNARASDLLTQRDRTHPGILDWPFEVALGPRAETIVAEARRRNASLIVLGLGEHGIAARLMQRETALQVIRAAPMPVLAVPSHTWGVPHSVIAGVDFTRSSERAAAAALALLGDEGTLYLAHVTPRTLIPHAEPPAWREPRSEAVLPKLEAVARRLRPRRTIRVEFVTLHGDPAHELLAFAAEREIDLIAAGAHGKSALQRLLLGSVSTTLIRAADRLVLVAPADGEASSTPAIGSPPNDGWT